MTLMALTWGQSLAVVAARGVLRFPCFETHILFATAIVWYAGCTVSTVAGTGVEDASLGDGGRATEAGECVGRVPTVSLGVLDQQQAATLTCPFVQLLRWTQPATTAPT